MFKFLLLATLCVLPASAVLDRHKCSTATWFRAARAGTSTANDAAHCTP